MYDLLYDITYHILDYFSVMMIHGHIYDGDDDDGDDDDDAILCLEVVCLCGYVT